VLGWSWATGGKKKERKRWAARLHRGKGKGGGGLGQMGFWPMAHIGNNNPFVFQKPFIICELI
jgi:hypothetical protein